MSLHPGARASWASRKKEGWLGASSDEKFPLGPSAKGRAVEEELGPKSCI